jgi:hypothetical protein
MKMAVFLVVAPCSLVEIYRCFRDACCFHHQEDDVWLKVTYVSEVFDASIIRAMTHRPDDGDSKHP